MNTPTSQSIFLDAIENHPPEDWPALVASACGPDGELRRKVLRLLEAHAQVQNFMAEPAGGMEAVSRAAVDQPVAQPLGTMIGPYKLLEQLGEGGMGIVYVAEQTEPVRRQVALKIIKPGMDSRQVIARFEAERQALAVMDHPNIARILDAGTVGANPKSETRNSKQSQGVDSDFDIRASDFPQRPYFVMELVRGQPITQYCDQAQLDIRSRLALFHTVCQAVQHAHQKGIIHRDLKPGNVMITLHDGVPVPKIIDFGVAKAVCPELADTSSSLESSRRIRGGGKAIRPDLADHTAISQLIGTPLYMSPEQAELGSQDVDTRSDVYSLGVLLYELLSGRTPFDKERLKKASFDEMRRMIREEKPPPPSQRAWSAHSVQLGAGLPTPPTDSTEGLPPAKGGDLRSGVSAGSETRAEQLKLAKLLRGELDWIVMKALEKDRNQRYESASALASDIRNYLDNLPIQARPASWWFKALKWRRRNPVAAISIAAGAVLSLLLLGGVTWHNWRLSQSLAVSDRLRKEGFERETVLRQQQYAGDMRMAWLANLQNNSAEVSRLLDRHEPRPNVPDVVGFEWHYLRHLSRLPLRKLTGHGSSILASDASPDALPGTKYVASSDKDGEVRIWELETGRLVKSLQYSNQEVTSVRFSPSGKLLATAGVDRIVHLWSVPDWQEVAALQQHQMTICGVAWSPDGKQLASAGRDQAVHIWDTVNKRLRQTLPHEDVVRAVAWSPDGSTLATADGERGVRLWETATWKQRGRLDCDSDKLLCLAFSPDNQVVATGGYSGKLRLFSAADQSQMVQATTQKQLWSLLFWDAHRLIAGTEEGLHFFQFDHRRKLTSVTRELAVGEQMLRSVNSARGGQLLVTASDEDRTVTIWDARSLLRRQAPSAEWPEAVLSSRGLQLTPAGDQAISVTRIVGGGEVARIPYDAKAHFLPEISPDDAWVAVPQADGRIGIWDAKSWHPVRFLDPLSGKVFTNIRFSPDGQWLATGLGGVAGVWNLQTGQWRELFRRDSLEAGMVSWSPGRNRLACSVWSQGDVEVWDLDRSQRLSQFQVYSKRAYDLCFLGDGTLAVAEYQPIISLWDAATGARRETLSGHTARVDSLALSKDGRTLASSSFDGTVRLWTVAARRELFVVSQHLPPPQQRTQRLTFLDDGSLFFTTIPGQEQWILSGSSSSPTASAGE